MQMDTQKKRNSTLDILRIFCCYCIIMLHVSGHLNLNGTFWRLVQGVVRPTLWCFLVLSGYFILSAPLKNWKKFYFFHLLHLIVPLIIYTFIYQYYYDKSLSLIKVIAGNSIGHLWFVYTLIMLYIIAPYLQILLIHLTNKQLTNLLILMFFFGRITNVMVGLGLSIGIPTEIVGSYALFYFILGYRLSRVKIYISTKILILCGIINILYSSFTFSNPILVNGAADLALSMVCGCIIYYFLFTNIFTNRIDKFSKITTFISLRTYGIYLIHMLVFQYFTANNIMPLKENSYSNIWILPLKCLIIFVISLAFTIIIDLLICEPIQRFYTYIYKKVDL